MTLFRILPDKRTKDPSDSEFLLLNEFSDDGKMHLRALDNRIRMIQKALKMSKDREIRSCHDCRRTYASIQYIHGVDIKTIQAQLGHSTPQQTWEIHQRRYRRRNKASDAYKGMYHIRYINLIGPRNKKVPQTLEFTAFP